MKRFILLTFGFLGWTFYELSGGSAFEPMSVRMAALSPDIEETTLATTLTDPVKAQVVTQAAAPAPAPQEETVTRVSLNLTTLQDALEASDSDEGTPAAAPAVPGNVITSGDTPAIIPSLIVPNDTGAVVQNASLGSGDIRTVSGARVNVRGGPGTDFGVVTKLARGDAVEILMDDGNGWVKMRPLDGGPEGWMADFLLEDG